MKVHSLPLLFALLLCTTIQSFAQSPQIPLRDGESVDFASFQRQLQTFAQDPVSKQTKGWKWLKRWEDFQAKRLTGSGEIPPAGLMEKEIRRVVAENNATQKQTASSSWVPLGPSSYADVGQNYWMEPGIGRINCIAFHPTQANTYWVGVAQGGVWKTVNDGQSWTPLTDDLPMLRVSDIAVNQANPDEMYICMGDYAYFGVSLQFDNRKRNTHYGLGVFKTTDGGATWNPTGLGFPQTDFDYSLMRRTLIHPSNPNLLVAGGTSGIWQSNDAGNIWVKKHDSIIWDIERSPSAPNVIYASTGYRHTMGRGTASILKSTNFGNSWTVLNTGIPTTGLVQRIELGLSATDPNLVYALCAGIDGGFAGFYRSTNAGTTWTLMASSPNILYWDDSNGSGGQGYYDLAILVDPNNNSKVYIGGINLWGSTDGGATWDGMSFWQNVYGPSIHADQHQFAYNPGNNKYYVCNDGGLYSTTNMVIGSWFDANNTSNYVWPTNWERKSAGMQATSFYRLSTSAGNPGNLIAGAQDNSTYYKMGSTWKNVIGGDGMECILHPTDPLKFYGSSQYGNLAASNDGGDSWYGIGWDISEQGEWTTPFLLHPTNPDVIYAAYGNVWKSTDAGNSFARISNFNVNQGLGQANQSSALAIAKSNPSYIYVGKRVNWAFNEMGSFQVSTNDGTTWQDRSAGLPDTLYNTYIAIDSDDPQTVWATFAGFTAGVKVFKSTNAGQSWANISGNLPNLPVNCIVHDGLHANNPIYVGTDAGVYYTNDILGTWQPYALDLPNAIVSELEIHESTQQLVAATFGRGLWGVDLKDITSTAIADASIDELEIKVVPNPNRGSFELQLEGSANQSSKLEIIDIMGRVVATDEIPSFSNGLKFPLNLSLKPGVYFARITYLNRHLTKKIVVE